MENINNFEERKGMFNQAQYSQERLHKLLTNCDTLNETPLIFDEEANMYYYEMIANNYQSIFLSIYAKLNPEEKEIIGKVNSLLHQFIHSFPVFQKIYPSIQNPSHTRIIKKYDNWIKISGILTNLRQHLEKAMEAHGLSNPDLEEDKIK